MKELDTSEKVLVPAEWEQEFEAAARRPLATRFRYAFIHTYKPVLDDARYRAFTTMQEYRQWCENNLPSWLAMAVFEYRQATEIRDALARRHLRYLFIGKSGAILLGFPDTTQDANLFVEKTQESGRISRCTEGSCIQLTEEQCQDLERGKDFVQLKNGP